MLDRTHVPPRLREELQIQVNRDGTADVRDPKQLCIFTLHASDIELGRSFDGCRTVQAIAQMHFAKTDAGSIRSVIESVEQLDKLDLLAGPGAEHLQPEIDNISPHAEFDCVERPLEEPLMLPPDGRWTCHACGACCHGLVVELTEREEARIDPDQYQDILGGNSFAVDSFIDPEAETTRVLRQREGSQACIFLDEAGLCLVHARQGPQAKPDACQAFPYLTIHTPRGPRLGMRTNCVSMHKSYQRGDHPEVAIPMMERLSHTHAALRVAPQVHWMGEGEVAEAVMDRLASIGEMVPEHLSARALHRIDARYFKGRIRRARAGYRDRLLAYAHEEAKADPPVRSGTLLQHWKALGVRKCQRALRRLGETPPPHTKAQSSFLSRQLRLALHGLGPLHFPDAGLGTMALLLGVEASLGAITARDGTKGAQLAFMAFTAPVLENTSHAWPILDALDLELAESLRSAYRDHYSQPD